MLALPIFPCSYPQSIVGADELNFCVRDGNRWTLIAINTNYIRRSPRSHAAAAYLSDRSPSRNPALSDPLWMGLPIAYVKSPPASNSLILAPYPMPVNSYFRFNNPNRIPTESKPSTAGLIRKRRTMKPTRKHARVFPNVTSSMRSW
mgnify:CR=1 FL=1